MKRVFAWAAAHLVAACYLLALALWALWALGNAGWDAVGFATGRLTTVQVPLSSLTSQDVALTDEGLWVTTGADPQFHLQAGQPVRSVLFETGAPASGFEGYYGKAGQDASLRRRVWAFETDVGQVTLVFPMGSSTVRIDPAGSEGVVLGDADTALVVNAPLPLGRYFLPLGEQALALAVLPALLAALWDLGAFWAARLRR